MAIAMPSNDASSRIYIYTDGACSGNPGPGGYGVIVADGDTRQEISAGFRRTTNNRMEIMAAIAGLRSLPAGRTVTVYTDSRYLVDAIELGWARRWRANGWRRNAKEMAVNPDLWTELLDLCAAHDVRFEWVRGHAGHAENERCDRLAVAASSGSGLPADAVYEAVSRR
jgi:ribonuclease HI